MGGNFDLRRRGMVLPAADTHGSSVVDRGSGSSRRSGAVFGYPRRDRQVALDAALANWTRTQAKKSLATMLPAAGVRAFPVMTSSDLVSDPQVVARHVLVDVPFGSSVAQLPGAPVRTSDPLFVAGPDAPRLGQHTREILMSDLQFDELRIDELVRRGVVATDIS